MGLSSGEYRRRFGIADRYQLPPEAIEFAAFLKIYIARRVSEK
jgi:hypothetical protein